MSGLFKTLVFSAEGVSRSKADYTAGLLVQWGQNAELDESGKPFVAQPIGTGMYCNVALDGPWGEGQPYRDELGDRIAEWARADQPPAPPDPERYRQAAEIGQTSLTGIIDAPDIAAFGPAEA